MIDRSLAALKALVEEGLDVKAARVLRKLRLPEGMLNDEEEASGQVPMVSLGLLTAAAQAGQQGIVELLIEEGCDPYGRDDDTGMPPHMSAAAGGHTALLEWLMTRYPIPLDGDGGEDGKGLLVLYLAAQRGQMETVRWLIGAGANPRLRNSGMLPSEIAE